MFKDNWAFSVILVLVVLGIFAAVGAYYYLSLNNPERVADSVGQDGVNGGGIIASPSAIPFFEMTIPSLRNRDYKSTLGEIVEISGNSSYTTYLTSYESDGLKVNGMLTIPIGQQPESGWPAIVFIHGYIPPKQYQTLVNYNSYVDYLARQNFVVFKIDLRGHANSEGEAFGAYYSGDYVIDALNARAALEASDFVRPGAIGFWGHSMAGNVVFRALAADLDIPAVNIWAGAVYTYEDLRQFGIDDDSYRPPDEDSERARRRRELFDTHGDFDSNNLFWKLVPGTNYLDGVKGALQIHHAVDDNVVDINYSRNLMSVLDKTSIPHQLFEYSDGGHNLVGSSFNTAMQMTVDFFKANL